MPLWLNLFSCYFIMQSLMFIKTGPFIKLYKIMYNHIRFVFSLQRTEVFLEDSWTFMVGLFLSCHVHVSEWIYTLELPECQGTPCSKQAWNLKFKWL